MREYDHSQLGDAEMSLQTTLYQQGEYPANILKMPLVARSTQRGYFIPLVTSCLEKDPCLLSLIFPLLIHSGGEICTWVTSVERFSCVSRRIRNRVFFSLSPRNIVYLFRMEFYLHIKAYPARMRAMWERKKKKSQPSQHWQKNTFSQVSNEAKHFSFLPQIFGRAKGQFSQIEGKSKEA